MSLREHLERWRDRHAQPLEPIDRCWTCHIQWPCPDFEDAVAALAQLPEDDGEVCLWMPDESYDDKPLGFPFGYLHANDDTVIWRDGFRLVHCRLVPDPLVPRLDANPKESTDA